jgi:hypothetical protein
MQDPFNMFAAPKEVPQNMACCQALKKRKVQNSTATSAPSNQVAMLGSCCGGAAAPREAAASHPAAAAEAHQVQHTAAAQAEAMQAALGSLMPARVVETFGASYHHAAAVAPPVPVAAPIAVGGGLPQSAGMPMPLGVDSMPHGFNEQPQAWNGMSTMSSAVPAAAAGAPSYFTAAISGGPMGAMAMGPMGWAAAPMMGLPMPGMAAVHMPAAAMPAQHQPAMQPQHGGVYAGPGGVILAPAPSNFPAVGSSVFGQQSSVVPPASAVPSPMMGYSPDSSSHQGSADNAQGAAAASGRAGCCSMATHRMVGGGRSGVSSSGAGAQQPPVVPAKRPAPEQRQSAAADAGCMSDPAMSDSDEEDLAAERRAALPLGGLAGALGLDLQGALGQLPAAGMSALMPSMQVRGPRALLQATVRERVSGPPQARGSRRAAGPAGGQRRSGGAARGRPRGRPPRRSHGVPGGGLRQGPVQPQGVPPALPHLRRAHQAAAGPQGQPPAALLPAVSARAGGSCAHMGIGTCSCLPFSRLDELRCARPQVRPLP